MTMQKTKKKLCRRLFRRFRVDQGMNDFVDWRERLASHRSRCSATYNWLTDYVTSPVKGYNKPLFSFLRLRLHRCRPPGNWRDNTRGAECKLQVPLGIPEPTPQYPVGGSVEVVEKKLRGCYFNAVGIRDMWNKTGVGVWKDREGGGGWGGSW